MYRAAGERPRGVSPRCRAGEKVGSMTPRVTRQLATACLVLAILLPVALLGHTAMARGLGDFKG